MTEEISSQRQTENKEGKTDKNKNNDNFILQKKVKYWLKKCHESWKWILQDVHKPHLLWVKLIFLMQSASLVVLYPYLTIHMRSLGFTIEDTAVVNTAVPLADIFGPPLAGVLADKIGNFRVFMSVVTFLNGAASLALLFIPKVRRSLDICCDLQDDPTDLVLACEAKDNFRANSLNKTDDVKCDLLQMPSQDLRVIFANSSNLCQTSGMTCHLQVDEPMEQWMISFSGYLTVRVVLDVFRASSLMLFEGAVMVIIKEQGGDYGLQKLFGTLGSVIFSPLAGKLVDLLSYSDSNGGHGQDDYTGVILLYFVLRAVTSVTILKLNLDFKAPAKKVFKNLGQVLCRYHVMSYLTAFSIAGLLWGFLETFLFWFLQDLGASKFLMGVSLAVGTIVGLPLTIGSRLLIGKLGHHIIIALALALYAVRLCGYSMITQAEYSLIFEVLKPFCTTLLMISAMTFVKDVSPVTTVASMEGIFGSLYFGVGRGLGGLFGAYSWEYLGARRTFQIFSIVSVSFACLHSLVNGIHDRQSSKEFSLESHSEQRQEAKIQEEA